ncbi:unnamed protein product [Eruca vesicaria subsp. sativa]|uniref:Uncharacterized protein n=1 Tax=Eruca vesicaria subsp. sativa TaxID=29727 RepID=A0ABC8L2G7_ERUVS|nr:unnamed protein product [Eruca vesicaria subsp. sativa]
MAEDDEDNLSACATYAMLFTTNVTNSSQKGVCNYPGYDEYNILLHNESEEHNLKMKLAEKEPQAEDCESKKRDPPVDLFNERKKQSLE